MPSAASVLYYLVHPSELRSILQWKVWHNPVHERDHSLEPPSLSACFDFLDLTSRSFSAVIQELNHELLIPICLFYLALRGLDTIEDDMTIPLSKKEPLLRGFDKVLEQDGWTFTDNRPNEKDRELLVHFHYVVTEFKKLKPEYRTIIQDITKRMGNGMADYANNAEHNTNGVNTIKEYELYCHYVAGLVGEGLTRLFVQGDSAKPQLMERPDLYESMGQFLQQTNIIRDIREDFEDGRRFWPKEVWSKYVNKWDDMFVPENREKALQCSSEMVALALERAPDCMFYLAGIKEQSVFNFAAIPQSMAIATLELCFRNPAIFDKNVKITKGAACRLMIQSSQNLQVLYGAFRTYARIIHHKNDPRDPNFLRISVACGKIEQFIESVFPSQDPRAIVPQPEEEVKKNADGQRLLTDAQKKKEQEERAEAWRDVAIMGTLISVVIVVLSFIMLFIAQKLGARFDLAWGQLKSGILVPDMDKANQQIAAEKAAAAASAGTSGAAAHLEL